MGRHERINALARAWATPALGAPPQVQEWTLRIFEPGSCAANTVCCTSRRDALAERLRAERHGARCEGPFQAGLALRA